MRKLLLVAILSMSLMTLIVAGCDNNPTSIVILNDDGNASDLLSQEVLYVSVTKISVSYTNVSDEVLLYGESRFLQKFAEQEGFWIDIEPPDNAPGWVDVGYLLNPQESFEQTYHLLKYFGELEPGTYRIFTEVSVDGAASFIAPEDNEQIFTYFELR